MSITIYEIPFEYPELDISKYNPSEVEHSITRIKLEGGKQGNLSAFKITIEYLIEHNYVKGFTFSAHKIYTFDPEYNSYHLLAFLTGVASKQFDNAFLKLKELNNVVMPNFAPPKVDDQSNEIFDALSSLQIQT